MRSKNYLRRQIDVLIMKSDQVRSGYLYILILFRIWYPIYETSKYRKSFQEIIWGSYVSCIQAEHVYDWNKVRQGSANGSLCI